MTLNLEYYRQSPKSDAVLTVLTVAVTTLQPIVDVTTWASRLLSQYAVGVATIKPDLAGVATINPICCGRRNY